MLKSGFFAIILSVCSTSVVVAQDLNFFRSPLRVSHRVACEFKVKILEVNKSDKSLDLNFKIIGLSDGFQRDEPYCRSQTGSEVRTRFNSPFPEIKQSGEYVFKLLVSGGKSPEGIRETAQWFYGDFVAEPVHSLTPIES